MNLNYVNSIAHRFMQFRSTLGTEENVKENLFNALSLYVPKSLALNNLSAENYEASNVTAEKFVVIKITADNYAKVLKKSGALYAQWLPVWNEGANIEFTLYVIVFDDTGFNAELGDITLSWAPLTKAFNELYFISFFKVMFSEHYNGVKNTSTDPHYNDEHYPDLLLCLASLCEGEPTLSYCLAQVTVNVPTAADENPIKILSETRAAEIAGMKKFTGTDKTTRAKFLWGGLFLIGGKRTTLFVHNGAYMLPIILGSYFTKKNDAREYVGNKLAKIRLTGNNVKPTGNPSVLDADVNLNLEEKYYKNLDAKNVGYFVSISGSSRNNSELLRDTSVEGSPCTAIMISKFIDYNTSQDIADYVSHKNTLTEPILVNEKAYKDVQSILVANIQKFTGVKRINAIKISFPPFEEAKQGNSFVGTAVWSASYVDDLESVRMTGSISF